VFAPIAPQLFADALGLELVPSIEGGSNYAVGGYQIADVLNSISGTGVDTASFGGGVSNAYLTDTGGVIPSNALILVDGGGNDVNAIVRANASTPENVPAELGISAANYIQSIRDLADAGAKYIMVSNVPDLGSTPTAQFFDQVIPGAAAGFTDATAGFNSGVATLANLSLADVNIIPVDINGFLNYAFDNAEAYGFAAGDLTTGSAVGEVTLDQRSMCYQSNNDCVEHPIYGINGTNPDPRRLIFNDTLHPAELTSEIFSDYLIDIIAAPQVIGMLPEMALTSSRTQTAVSGGELRRSRWNMGEGRLFVAGDMASDELETGLEAETENTSLTVGRTFIASESLIYGAALTIGQQELDIDNADFESDSWGLSGLLGYRKDNLFIDATAALSVLSYDDLQRDIKLATVTKTATGDTEGHAWAVDVLAGYNVLSSDAWHLAPAIGLQYINTTVDGYNESGDSIANYAWGEQSRKSMQLRYGAVTSGDITQKFRIFGEIFAVKEQESDDETLSIRNTNLNFQSYKLPSFQAQDDFFINAAVGGSLDVFDHGSVNLTVNYSDRGEGYEQVVLSYSMPM
jgi:outer membrane lipase/esterase